MGAEDAEGNEGSLAGRREPLYLSWSGGKDCALALYELRRGGEYDVVGLQTTVTDAYDRSSIHGIRRPLLRTQARLLGLPVDEVVLPVPSSYDSYEQVMLEALAALRERGIRTVAFGDLCLEDIREYRENLLARAGLRALFPLWGLDTRQVGERFIELGFKARLVAVDRERLSAGFLGRPYDHRLLDDLPGNVDPAGEKGEFHTFVFDGPIFSGPVKHGLGETMEDGPAAFLDLLPEESGFIRPAR